MIKLLDPLAGPRSREIMCVEIGSGCWVCVSHTRDKMGYPVLERNGRSYRMSRYVYESYKGEIPDGLVVMHVCDNPNCVNPGHLKVGTTKDNSLDMVQKGRSCFGVRNGGGVKLRDDLIPKIRQDNRPLSKIAKHYGVSKKLILLIKQRKIWRHIS